VGQTDQWVRQISGSDRSVGQTDGCFGKVAHVVNCLKNNTDRDCFETAAQIDNSFEIVGQINNRLENWLCSDTCLDRRIFSDSGSDRWLFPNSAYNQNLIMEAFLNNV
jgi:hypothetical protein